ncbi:MAG TPA: ATP-dependent DNA helicase, partial [Planctomycetota bacterium]|nr:ATP-dependent DNA helicase [Planctomycetota bacterium]
FRGGRKVPPQLARMDAEDLVASVFPDQVACAENLVGEREIPDHPLVQQTLDDCLHEAMDADGWLALLRDLESGAVTVVARDLTAPSPFAAEALNARPYAFLDDAPLEERRTQAVMSRRTLDPGALDGVGALDPAAVERVRAEAWPQPESAEELHDALVWMGYVTDDEAAPWMPWIDQLVAQNRIVHGEGRWFAVDGPNDPKKILLGRLEALGPVYLDDPLLNELEHEGSVLRTRLNGRTAWCERRLLARIHRYTLDALRREIEPVTASEFLQFLACWQHADPEYMLEGPRGVAEVLTQLAGMEAPAKVWESQILPRRVREYRREWLDELTLGGEFAWGRLWGSASSAVRVTPIGFVPREHLDDWLALTEPPTTDGMSGPANDLLAALRSRGPMFPQNLPKAANLVPAHVEMGLAELLARGAIACDSFGALRQMLTPPSRRPTAAPTRTPRPASARRATRGGSRERAAAGSAPPTPAPAPRTPRAA